MALKLTAPSKTFIVGEYLALVGGATLVAATDERFELLVDLSGHSGLEGIHPDSPAGRVYTDNLHDFDGVQLNFVDPYKGSGGLGASSAQFVLMSLLKNLLKNNLKTVDEQLTAHQVWLDYRSLFSTSSTWMPSGADVVAQLIGGISSFQWKPFKVEKLSWSFEGLGFLIFKTPNKVSTHDHLKELNQLDVEKLQDIVAQATESLKEADAFQFVKSVQQYDVTLREQNLVCDKTIEILNNLKMSQSVLAAKGCGALGADTIFVVCEDKNIEALKSLAQVVGLKFVASNKTVSAGVQIEYNYDFKKHLAFKHNDTSNFNEVTL